MQLFLYTHPRKPALANATVNLGKMETEISEKFRIACTRFRLELTNLGTWDLKVEEIEPY